MELAEILGDIDPHAFVADYFHRLPYSQVGRREPYLTRCGWQLLVELLKVQEADVMLTRRNQRYQGKRPASEEDAERLADAGYTMLVRHAEMHHPLLRELSDAFARSFGGEVNIHMYATPASEFGFGWHYDAEDVFILQTEGDKEYSLRKNTVHPWPLVETIPADMRYEREIMPLMRVLLSAGDWLYIPNGYWHFGKAEQRAVSLAVGVMSPSAIDLFDFLRLELVESLLWRQRLSVVGQAAADSSPSVWQRYRELTRELAADLAKRLDDEQFVERWMESRRAGPP